MGVEQHRGADSTWIDVLDRVLDKGVVIDAAQRVALSLGGIDLVTVNVRIVVVSIETYLETVLPAGRERRVGNSDGKQSGGHSRRT